MLLAGLVILQCLHVEICLHQYGLYLKGNGIHFLYVAGQFIVFALFAGAGVYASAVNGHLHHLESGHRIAVYDGGQCHKHTLLLVVIIGPRAKGGYAHNQGQ